MKKFILTMGAAAVLSANSLLVSAGPVNFTTLGNITAGSPANASDVATAFNEVMAALGDCPADMVKAGPVCVDKYEASLWSAPDGGSQIAASTCLPNGNDCSATDPQAVARGTAIYARSVDGVPPAVDITWYQARQACANVGKRLLTNAEWQMAAAGTADDAASCNINGGVANTGAMAACLSNWGANDMVGNASEWVADWLQGDTAGFPSGNTNDIDDVGDGFGSDAAAGTNAATNQGGTIGLPSALHRGGTGAGGAGAGVFAINADAAPSVAQADIGFRCGRSL